MTLVEVSHPALVTCVPSITLTQHQDHLIYPHPSQDASLPTAPAVKTTVGSYLLYSVTCPRHSWSDPGSALTQGSQDKACQRQKPGPGPKKRAKSTRSLLELTRENVINGAEVEKVPCGRVGLDKILGKQFPSVTTQGSRDTGQRKDMMCRVNIGH